MGSISGHISPLVINSFRGWDTHTTQLAAGTLVILFHIYTSGCSDHGFYEAGKLYYLPG